MNMIIGSQKCVFVTKASGQIGGRQSNTNHSSKQKHPFMTELTAISILMHWSDGWNVTWSQLKMQLKWISQKMPVYTPAPEDEKEIMAWFL